ncbi:gamma-glutamylcyclotransferase [Aestuariivirga sp.]|uniref:gamma-glutamylcyclotransferase n=1 Tax=Aestuariivirga sp. TaxID=2650926 RepID=UPI00391AB50C
MRRKVVLTHDLVARVDRKIPQDHLPPDPDRVPMTDEDFARAVQSILREHGPGPVWVFGYGSLLWNPGFSFDTRRGAWLRGWHRAFCMQLLRFRGSPEQPGLMLALDHGGSCKGEVFRIPEEGAAAELDRLMRREVPYRRLARAWRWVEVDIEGERQKALTFYAGMRRDRFYVRLPLHAQAHMLARAAGHGGSGAAYLHHTVLKLEELGIHDSYLWELQHLVAAEIRAMAEPSGP